MIDQTNRRFIVTSIVTVAFFIYVGYVIDWKDIKIALQHVDGFFLLLSFLFFVASTLFRAYRLWLVSSERGNMPRRKKLIAITFVYSAMNYLLPMKLGEAVYPLLLSKHSKKHVSEGVANLVTVRLLDFFTIFSLATVIFCISSDLDAFIGERYYLAGFSALVVMLLSLLYLKLHTFSRMALGLVNRIRLISLQGFLVKLFSELENFRAKVNVSVSVLFSLFVWMAVFSNVYFLMKSIGMDASYGQTVIILLVMIPISLLPMQGIANSGGHELAWVGVLVYLGNTQQQALVWAVASHALLLVFVLIIGGLGMLMIRFNQGE